MSSKADGFFLPSDAARTSQKPPDSGGFFPMLSRGGDASSEPLGAAVIMVTVPVAVTLDPAVTPAALPTETVRVGEDGKPALLALVQRLVERIGGVGDLLQRGRRGRHVVGALAQPRDRIIRLLLILGVFPRLDPRLNMIDPQLGEIPHCALHRWPQLLLVRRQLQSGMDRGNPRIGERRTVLRAHPHE